MRWLVPVVVLLAVAGSAAAQDSLVTPQVARTASGLFGIPFSPPELDSLVGLLEDQLADYRALRQQPVGNGVPPALVFNPHPAGYMPPAGISYLRLPKLPKTDLPRDSTEIAFASLQQLGQWLRRGALSSVQLTGLYLGRLRRYGPELACVVTLTDSLAYAQARQADAELARGVDRGPLHGIPYGLKDLFATRGYRTTWGAGGLAQQWVPEDATVVQALEAAGAVLVAKLTLGELAMGDVWFGGKTRNPFNPSAGSSGSSAGSASAVAAGLVPFAIGTETLGSIVSPSTVCGVTGLRPTFGRIDRTGAMALSWSMDKVGPIARSAIDCAQVFDALYRVTGQDPAHRVVPFQFDAGLPLKSLRVGYLKADFERPGGYPFQATDSTALAQLRSLGIELQAVELPALAQTDLTFLLLAEAATAFDDLTRSGADDRLVQQGKNAWPNLFRAARFIPAVEYLQANRLRTQLIHAMNELFETEGLDLIVAPSWVGRQLRTTNLTGHPCVVLPTGFSNGGKTNHSICILGRLYEEGAVLRLAAAYQEVTRWDERRPEGFE
ncbi:MAG: amidase [Bacteroidia bacterium]|nr:amidase [Bacteroidia bacterium]